MWINFEAKQPFAVMVFLGGVNAISGEHMADIPATLMRRENKVTKSETIQNYVVIPDQDWIDGIANDQGIVRQFVAMPLGAGYSVEAQVTGQEVTGGLQFLVIPSRPPPPRLYPEVFNNGDSFGLIVKTLTGEAVGINNLSSNTTIDGLKYAIRKCEGIPVDQQRLIYAGKQLEDGKRGSLVLDHIH